MNSYVFYLFRPHPAEDPLQAAQGMFPPRMKPAQHSMDPLKHNPQEAPKAPTGIVDPDLDDLEDSLEGQEAENDQIRDGLAHIKFKISQRLTERNPDLQYPEAVQIAVQVGSSLEMACRPFRELSLRAEATNDVRIDIFDFGARISIPFAIIGDEVRQIFGEVWEYIHMLRRTCDFAAYDPQLGRMIRNTADMILAMTGYEYLYTEQLRADSKAKGLFPEGADQALPDDATQPLRPDHVTSPGYPPMPQSGSAAPPPHQPERRKLDDTGHGSVAAGSSSGYHQSGDSESSGASPRKNWWKFW